MGLFFEIQTILDPTDIHTVHVDQNQPQHYTFLKLSDFDPFAVSIPGSGTPRYQFLYGSVTPGIYMPKPDLLTLLVGQLYR